MIGADFCGRNRRIAIACRISLPRTASQTRRALRGETRMFFVIARTSIVPPFAVGGGRWAVGGALVHRLRPTAYSPRPTSYRRPDERAASFPWPRRSEEHTSELQ